MTEVTSPALTRVWASGGRYLREKMIRAFIEGIGHDWPTLDPGKMLEQAQHDLPNETQEMLASAEALNVESEDEDDN